MTEARCVKCGHTAADHSDGILGASMWTAGEEQPLCHTDDHSCYVWARTRTQQDTYGLMLDSMLYGDAYIEITESQRDR